MENPCVYHNRSAMLKQCNCQTQLEFSSLALVLGEVPECVFRLYTFIDIGSRASVCFKVVNTT